MVYTYNGGIQKEKRSKFTNLIIAATAALILSAAIFASSASALPVSGPGNVQVGVDASTWTSGLPSGPGLLPIGGGGQVNGGFTTTERNGIQIGLRGQQRSVGVITPTENSNGKVGIYSAPTGADPTNPARAWWNYDYSVDLRNAKGAYAGKTMGDFTLRLSSSLWGNVEIDPTVIKPYAANTILYQESTNPAFVPTFNMNAEGTYDFRLVLTPKTFNGPALAVAIQVVVTAPAAE